jgi:hypothetical protein
MRNRKEDKKAKDEPKPKKDIFSAMEKMEERLNARGSGGSGKKPPGPFFAAGLIVLPVPFYVAAWFTLVFSGWGLFNEQEVLDANVLHPIFKSDKHYHEPFWKANMTQRERLEGLTEAVHGTSQALEKVGIQAFLESSNLIGWVRHDASHIPWDIDGDLGMSVAECKESKATKAALEKVIDPRLAVLKFACECEEDCEGDNLRMVGRIAHRTTGVCVDIFAYAPVAAEKLADWQITEKNSGTEWWARVNDHADFTFPEPSLFPLQDGTFENQPIRIPNDPREFLSWEYGKCLGTHIWPWRILIYTPMTFWIIGATAMKCVGLLAGPLDGRAQAFALSASANCFASMALFKGSGVGMLMLWTVCLGELIVMWIWPNFLQFPARIKHRCLTLLVMTAITYELKGCAEMIYCGIDDRFISPRRPQVWTFCLFGVCKDF